jgi:hypothetical protein
MRFMCLTRIPAAPLLDLLAVAFLLRSLPFEPIDLTYSEIMDLPLHPDQVTQGIRLLSVLLKRPPGPSPSRSSLVEKHGRKVSHSSLVPVYEFVIHRLPTFDSAVRFVRAVAAIDPSIAVQKETRPSRRRRGRPSNVRSKRSGSSCRKSSSAPLISSRSRRVRR